MLLDELVSHNPGPLPGNHLRAIYREILSSSRALQRTIKVAYLGPEGNFSHMAEVLQDKKGLLFVALSGIAGATSWLFYFLALKYGPVSKVAPIDKLSVVFAVILAIILFGEKVSLVHACAIAMIAAGGLILAIW